VRQFCFRSTRVASLLVLLAIAACRPAVNSAVELTPVASPSATPVADPPVELCPNGASPEFDYGFAALRIRLGDKMGEPLSCERPGPLGDSVQQTTTGYARYNKATNTPTFTRGSEHWALTAQGLVHWGGSALDPPADAEQLDPVDETAAPGIPVAAAAALASLHFTYVPAAVRTYTSTTRLTFDSPLPGSKAQPPLEIDMRYTYRTLDVHADQSATMLASIDDVAIWSGSSKTPASVPELKHLSVRSVVSPDGSTVTGTEHVERGGQGVDDALASQVRESMITFAYPSSPLHTGDAFERDLPLYLGPSLPRTTVHSTYTFIGLGSLNAVDVARVEENSHMLIGDWPSQNGVSLTDGQLTAHGWHYIGLADGWPVSGESDVTLTFLASKSIPGGRAQTGAAASPLRATFRLQVNTSYRLL
jgi:hypothetical protein